MCRGAVRYHRPAGPINRQTLSPLYRGQTCDSIISGATSPPLTAAERVRVIGKDDVGSPPLTYLKSSLPRGKVSHQRTLAVGAFVVPNRPIGFVHPLTEFQNLCNLDSCKLMSTKDFSLYIATRKVGSAGNVFKLDKVMSELKEAGNHPG
ncbi:hypothetical protein SKAU_G00109980 [Synaphobranchus kaupii]|uniref:EXOG C-terminal domain-containing protein n=1 Tax=Synaphobranchus kaupii TaxID=118154 RepID=A0A9Q1G074_SYNKA|nr:hypothetical protein SKAU_G00109980 [Synaphobranchus kaupii]